MKIFQFQFVASQENGITLTTKLMVMCTKDGVPKSVQKEATIKVGYRQFNEPTRDITLEGDGQLAEMIQYDQLFPDDSKHNSLRWLLKVHLVGPTTAPSWTFSSSHISNQQQACIRAYGLVLRWIECNGSPTKVVVAAPPPTRPIKIKDTLKYMIEVVDSDDQSVLYYTTIAVRTNNGAAVAIKHKQYSADQSGEFESYSHSDFHRERLLPESGRSIQSVLTRDVVFPERLADFLKGNWKLRVKNGNGRVLKLLHSHQEMRPIDASAQAVQIILDHISRIRERILEQIGPIPFVDLSK